MSQLILTREQSRAVDKIAIEEFGISGVVLMENAGRNVAEILLQQPLSGQVTILCGKGNNGGDGFVIARHLDNREIPVFVVLIEDPQLLTGDAETNFQIMQKSGIPFQHFTLPDETYVLDALLQKSEWIVDALLGTGVQGKARGPYLEAIQAVNRAHRKVLAVDVPSGLDTDTGAMQDATISADMTATFVALKQGLATENGRKFAGEIIVIDIGVPRKVLSKVITRE